MKFEKCLICAYKGKLIQKCSYCVDQSNYKHVFEPLNTNGNHTCMDCANVGKKICHDCDMGDKFKWEESKLSLTVPPLEDVPIHADGEYTVTSDVPQKDEEKVSHPNHYNKGIEVWDYIISHDMNFMEGNIIKYISRYKHKNGIEDLRKARFYLDKLIEVVEKENEKL